MCTSGNYDKIEKNARIRIDVMNNNAIVSLAMLYALWESKHQDLLGVIRPFVLYAVGEKTTIGSKIEITDICEYMITEFGYKTFQAPVIHRILQRESTSSGIVGTRIIEKRNKSFYLVSSLGTFLDDFVAKRTDCKGHSDAVCSALAGYLNERNVNNRKNYTRENAENLLLSFMTRNGSTILSATEDLRYIKAKNNEMEYIIGRFVLDQYDKKSVLWDFLIELVKGHFITTALFFQAENLNVTKAAFSDVTFYLDTRILLGFLGYKTQQENDSVGEMIRSLQKNGANLSCFPYNLGEVDSILEAYKQSTISHSTRPSNITLEFFDERNSSFSAVDAAQKVFEKRLESGGIIPKGSGQALDENECINQFDGLIPDGEFEEIIKSIRPNYNLATLPDDLAAINTVSRIRGCARYEEIEKCKAVFVTPNTVLVAAVRQYLRQNNIDTGFPIAITSEDLCVMAWLKDFERNNALPQMRLLENVLAAVTPDRDLLDEYFNVLEVLTEQGEVPEDEVAVLRVDLFARQELMELTRGTKERVTKATIRSIRQKMTEESHSAGIAQGRKVERERQQQERSQHRSNACKKAEQEVEKEFAEKEDALFKVIRGLSVVVAIFFVVASVVVFASEWDNPLRWPILIVSFIGTAQGALPFLCNGKLIRKIISRCLKNKKYAAIDRRKAQYMDILDGK